MRNIERGGSEGVYSMCVKKALSISFYRVYDACFLCVRQTGAISAVMGESREKMEVEEEEIDKGCGQDGPDGNGGAGQTGISVRPPAASTGNPLEWLGSDWSHPPRPSCLVRIVGVGLQHYGLRPSLDPEETRRKSRFADVRRWPGGETTELLRNQIPRCPAEPAAST